MVWNSLIGCRCSTSICYIAPLVLCRSTYCLTYGDILWVVKLYTQVLSFPRNIYSDSKVWGPRSLPIIFPKRLLEGEEGQLVPSFLQMPKLFSAILAYSRSCYMQDYIWFLSHHPRDKNKGKVSPKQLIVYISNYNLPCSRIFMLAFKTILMNVDTKDLINSFFLPAYLLSRGIQNDKAAAIILTKGQD